MVDGIVQIEISDKGKYRLKSLEWLDFRLENVVFDDAEGLEQLIEQLPNELLDSLILVTFKYSCNCNRDFEGEWDVEEWFTVVNYQVLKNNYKEFYSEIVTEDLKFQALTRDKEWLIELGIELNDLVEEWEEFYEEEFLPLEVKDTDISN